MKNRGFTLIELLVVISIIGVIASIVLVSFSGSRDKAKLAKSQQFSANINHSLGAYAVGIWRFEEAAGIDIHDESGYGNHGTFYGNPTPVFPDGVYSGTKALQFDGVNDYVDCNIHNFNNDEGTIEMWIKPNFDGAASFPNHIYFFRSPETNKSFQIWSGNGYLYWLEGWTYCSKSRNWKAGKWYHIVATWKYPLDSANQSGVELYMNTEICGHMQNNATYNFTSTGRISENFNGTIDDVRIYNHALSAAQIQQHYALGAEKHEIALNK